VGAGGLPEGGLLGGVLPPPPPPPPPHAASVAMSKVDVTAALTRPARAKFIRVPRNLPV